MKSKKQACAAKSFPSVGGIAGQPCHLLFCLASQAVFAISCGFYAMSAIVCFYYILLYIAEQISTKHLGERK